MHVIDQQRLDRQRNITRNRTFVDRQQKFACVELHGGFFEADVSRFVGAAMFFAQINRAAVGRSEFDGRIQHEFDQAVKIPLGGERLPHCRQPADFNIAVGKFLLQVEAVIFLSLIHISKFRSRPDKSAPTIAYDPGNGIEGSKPKTDVIPAGARITLIARTPEKHNVEKWENYWYLVEVYGLENYRGWVFGELLKKRQ